MVGYEMMHDMSGRRIRIQLSHLDRWQRALVVSVLVVSIMFSFGTCSTTRHQGHTSMVWVFDGSPIHYAIQEILWTYQLLHRASNSGLKSDEYRAGKASKRAVMVGGFYIEAHDILSAA